jgi:eukaryotic-like serine/threonine-protein kinase
MRTSLGLYIVEEALGRGGMGVVYRGVHSRLDRAVAIKELAPELTRQPEFRNRFFAEARTQARLQHPNIVTVYDLIEDRGEFFIVMEHVDGRPLDNLLHSTQGHRLEPGQAIGLFSQVLMALDYAHSEAVIHRDIKPSNILVTAGGKVKLMDFGIGPCPGIR